MAARVAATAAAAASGRAVGGGVHHPAGAVGDSAEGGPPAGRGLQVLRLDQPAEAGQSGRQAGPVLLGGQLSRRVRRRPAVRRGPDRRRRGDPGGGLRPLSAQHRAVVSFDGELGLDVELLLGGAGGGEPLLHRSDLGGTPVGDLTGGLDVAGARHRPAVRVRDPAEREAGEDQHHRRTEGDSAGKLHRFSLWRAAAACRSGGPDG